MEGRERGRKQEVFLSPLLRGGRKEEEEKKVRNVYGNWRWGGQHTTKARSGRTRAHERGEKFFLLRALFFVRFPSFFYTDRRRILHLGN